MNGTDRQSNLSDDIRGIVKRRAAQNGGMASMLRDSGLGYQRAWAQMNRSQGVRVDLIPALDKIGIEEILQRVAAECGKYVIPKLKFLRKRHAQKPLRGHAIDLVGAAYAVAKEINEALVDNYFDSRESVLVQDAATKLQEVLAVLIYRTSETAGAKK